MTDQDIAELYYLVGRLIGLRTRLGHDIDQVVYYDNYRIRIDTAPHHADEIERLRAINAELVAALERLANAADAVGVQFFDTDTMAPEVEEMQAATLAARAALAKARR